MQNQQPQSNKPNPTKEAPPTAKPAQGAKPVYPETTKVDGKNKKSDDSCGC